MCLSCFLGSLFTRQLDFLHCDVQIRAAWEEDVISEKSKLFPRSIYTAARHWVKNLNKNWFLDHQQQPLMTSFRVKVNSEICILASKASGNWNRGKGKCLCPLCPHLAAECRHYNYKDFENDQKMSIMTFGVVLILFIRSETYLLKCQEWISWPHRQLNINKRLVFCFGNQR